MTSPTWKYEGGLLFAMAFGRGKFTISFPDIELAKAAASIPHHALYFILFNPLLLGSSSLEEKADYLEIEGVFF